MKRQIHINMLFVKILCTVIVGIEFIYFQKGICK